MIILNLNEILNSTISGLLCSIIVAMSTILFRVLKKSYLKDSRLFWYNIFFYFDVLALVYNAIMFRLDKCSLSTFSFGDTPNLFSFIAVIICLICVFVQYSYINRYIKQTNQN